jgi:site-specific DNA-methyltransferase (adenine-specific)
MERVPNDLTCPVLREEYLKNHIDWFLKNHENAIEAFKKAVQKKYGVSAERSTKKRNSQKQLVQKELF